jgi:L-lysine exporter family protein LysE/ArgO
LLGVAGEGFLLGLSLILAIGAQNAFVLRQGLLRRHVLAVCLVCALSDALLIAAGVAGFGVLVQHHPALPRVMTWLGAAFLFFYGMGRLRAAWDAQALHPAEGPAPSLRQAVAACLAFTWLNPHVYLDTVVLLGESPRAWRPASGCCSVQGPPPHPSPSSSASATAHACSRPCSSGGRPGVGSTSAWA